MSKEEANYIVNHYYYDVMHFCGCYTPGEVLNKLEEILSVFNRDDQTNWENHTKYVGDNLVLTYLIDMLGLTEHGGSVGGAWLSKKGKDLLEALKASDDDWDDEDISGWAVEPTRLGFESAEAEQKTFMDRWGK